MNIELKNDTIKVELRDIENGNLFLYFGKIFMKCEFDEPGRFKCMTIPVVNIKTGIITYWVSSTDVIPLEQIEPARFSMD